MLVISDLNEDIEYSIPMQDVCCLLDAKGMLARGMLLAGIAADGTVDKVDGALCNLLITCRLSAINLVVSIKNCIFAADI